MICRGKDSMFGEEQFVNNLEVTINSTSDRVLLDKVIVALEVYSESLEANRKSCVNQNDKDHIYYGQRRCKSLIEMARQ